MLRLLSLIVAVLWLAATPLAQGQNVSGASGSVAAGGVAPNIQYNKGLAFAGSASLSFYDTPLAKPTAPTISQTGTPASKSFFYSYVALPLNGLFTSVSSDSTEITVSTNSPNSSNYNTIQTFAVTGATTCYVFRDPKTSDSFQGAGINIPTGNVHYVGSVNCGSSIDDKGGFPAVPANLVGYGTLDQSAGVLLANNLQVQGALSVGSGVVPGAIDNPTSGNSWLNVSATELGSPNIHSDPYLAVFNYTLDVRSGLYVNQPWGIYLGYNVAATTVTNIYQLQPLSIVVLDAATHYIQGIDGVLLQITLNSGVKCDIATKQCTTVDAINSSLTVNNISGSTYGILSAVAAGGASGEVQELTSFVANWNAAGGQVVDFAAGYSVKAATGSGAVVAYESFHSEDNHATGVTSYGVHIKGIAYKNFFEGPVFAGALVSKGTTFAASGCSNSSLAGGTTAGKFVSGTTGACAVTVTMGDAQAAPTGWACSADNTTTTANLYQQSGGTTTTATFTGTTVSGDVIRFACTGY